MSFRQDVAQVIGTVLWKDNLLKQLIDFWRPTPVYRCSYPRPTCTCLSLVHSNTIVFLWVKSLIYPDISLDVVTAESALCIHTFRPNRVELLLSQVLSFN